MDNRDELLISLRPKIAFNEVNNTEEAQFTHSVLRPILKLQHAHLVQISLFNIRKYKPQFDNLPQSEQKLVITNFIRENNALRKHLQSSIVALFSESDLAYYLENTTVINKRLNDLLSTRIVSAISYK